MKKLELRQLDRRINPLRDCMSTVDIPSLGWIKTIRNALRMTTKQLGERANKSQQSISQLERNEIERTIMLKSLEEIAQALNCKVYYAFIPEDNLESRFNAQILKKAQQEVAYVDHSMKLENQQTSKEEREHQMDRVKYELEHKNTQRIWDLK